MVFSVVSGICCRVSGICYLVSHICCIIYLFSMVSGICCLLSVIFCGVWYLLSGVWLCSPAATSPAGQGTGEAAEGRRRLFCFPTTQTAHCKLHTAHCTLHTTHYTLHTVHWTLHTAGRGCRDASPDLPNQAKLHLQTKSNKFPQIYGCKPKTLNVIGFLDGPIQNIIEWRTDIT